MELTGKNVKIHLSTPLKVVDVHGDVATIKGKILEQFSGGFLVQIETVEPKKNAAKYAYSTVFIPTHKIDFIGVAS